jgi:hypothetical protein
MAEQRGGSKALSTIITVGALLFTVGTGVYALSLSGTAKRVDALEVRQASQDVSQGIIVTKMDGMKEQLIEIKTLLTKHVDGGSK